MKADLAEALLRAVCNAADQPTSDFDLNTDSARPLTRSLRPAAVLVPLIETAKGAEIVLTKRSSRLKHHPGQIAFPGGKVDEADTGPEAAALREAHEEIGLPSANVEIIGTLPGHETVTGFHVTPIVGKVQGTPQFVAEEGEVAEVFTVPVAHVLRAENYIVESRLWRGQRRFYYAVPYGPYYIWGATARILRAISAGAG